MLQVAEEKIGPAFIPRNGRALAIFRDGAEIEKVIASGPKQMHEVRKVTCALPPCTGYFT